MRLRKLSKPREVVIKAGDSEWVGRLKVPFCEFLGKHLF